ncbi:F-box protein [Senna tora]|uniref:F-box protein n=1 Tax=Senna tora TaxID=362788 RepID=A0A834XAT0_9FABA|nr:F-box protein [Senna tora]
MVPRLPNLTDFRCKILSEGKQTERESDSFRITLFNLRTTNVEHVKALDGNGTKLLEQSNTSRISTWRCLNAAAIHWMRSEVLIRLWIWIWKKKKKKRYDGNMCADLVAIKGLSAQKGIVLFEDPPPFVIKQLEFESREDMDVLGGIGAVKPHFVSVKVFILKCRNMAMSSSCHWSWEALRLGRMGRGGGLRLDID